MAKHGYPGHPRAAVVGGSEAITFCWASRHEIDSLQINSNTLVLLKKLGFVENKHVYPRSPKRLHCLALSYRG